MNVLAVDPGSSESAYVFLRDGCPVKFDKVRNDVLRAMLSGDTWYGWLGETPEDVLAIETIESYGMGFAKDIAITLIETGRLIEAWGGPYRCIPRKDVKLTLCGTMRGVNDAVIRQRVIDHYGGEAAIGGVRCQRCKGKGWRGRERTPCADCHDEVEVFEHEWPGTDGHTWVTKGSGWRVSPGPLHGMAGDCWQALAVALTWLERNGTP
jgi:hypothetical protein